MFPSTVPTHPCTNFGQTIPLAWVKTYGKNHQGRFLGLVEGGFLKTQNLTLDFKGSNEHFCKFSNVVNVPHEGGGVKIDFVIKPLDFKGGIFDLKLPKK